MIDRKSRQKAVSAIERFINCQTTNNEYEMEYPGSKFFELFAKRERKDLAIQAISDLTWYWYDDLSTHKLDGIHSLSSEQRSVGERCLLFLQNDLEYEWKRFKIISIGAHLTGLVSLGREPTSLGLLAHHLEPAEQSVSFTEWLAILLAEPEGDTSVWPFFRRSDYELSMQAAEFQQESKELKYENHS